MNIILLSAAFFLSGLCALIYQTIWIYQFSRVFGSTIFAMSFVVAVFFVGLALGSRVFGKAASKSTNPIRLYALLELAIGAYALAFPVMIAIAEKSYARLYPTMADSFALITIVRMLLAFGVMFLPALLMGGTLPVLLTHFADRLTTLSRRAGLIYGLNALGAALGSFLTGYALLEALGVAWTNALAGMLNLAIGLLALALSRPARDRLPKVICAAKPQPKGVVDGETGRHGDGGKQLLLKRQIILVTVAFAVSGFVSMSYEVLWLRYLSFYFHETIYLYTGIIIFFVLGIGVGSLICGYLVSKIRYPVAFLGLLQAGIGISTMLAIYLPIRYFDSIYTAGVRSGGNILMILGALLFIPAALMGATFPLVTKLIVTDLREVGSQVGRAYALNTAGCILGLLCSGFVLLNFLGLQLSLYILFGLNLLLAAILLVADRQLARRYLIAVPLIIGVAAVIIIQRWDLHLPQAVMRTRLRANEELLEVREGLVGITFATRGKGGSEVHLWDNGVRISRGGRSTFLAQGYIPMLIAPRIPRAVLGLAFGAGLSYRGVRLFPEVRRLDFVDISKDNIAVALTHFPENAGLKDDPRVRFIVDDAYSYVKYNVAQYDLILMEPTPPRYGYQTAALYTREFYELIRRRLTGGGCFAQVLPLNDLSPEETMSVMRTFSASFTHCLLWRNGWDCLMLGSDQEFRLNIQTIGERLNRPEVQRTLRECAPLVDNFSVLDNFISGLLLADECFRNAASGGKIYTNDNTGLRFTTGRNITTDNIRNIHSHLSPWRDIRKLFDKFPDFERKESLFTVKREYFMALLYTTEPDKFYAEFLKYIRRYSQKKDADLKALHKYLLERNMTAQATEVEDMLDRRAAKSAEDSIRP
ncbi:MAG: fused MFS/spermidine synthase [Planctomycetota bacterium]